MKDNSKLKTRLKSLGIAIAILVLAIVVVKALPKEEAAEIDLAEKKGTLVEVIVPVATDVEKDVTATGKLQSTKRFKIVAQVEGQLLHSAYKFKEGNTYRKGQVLLEIDQQEYQMSLLASKSELVTLITSLLPDLKSDYPSSYPLWRAYVGSIDVKKAIPEIPEVGSEQENFYLSGKGIYSKYYQVRSAEEKLAKYTIRAPYNGVVVSSVVESGTAVRPGTEMGTFINTDTYDLELNIPLSKLEKVTLGTNAVLSSSEFNGEWKGKVVRIGGDINEQTQSVKVFVRTSGASLKEGMYLTARIHQQPYLNAMTLPRKMVSDSKQIFVVDSNILRAKKVNILALRGDVAVIEALPVGTQVLSTVVKSAYAGMPVRVLEAK